MSKKDGTIQVPDYLRSVQAPSAESMVSRSDSIPRISLKGQVFRFREGGEDVKKVKGPLDVVIVGVEPQAGLSKTFYLHGYTPDSSDPPDCSSWDGIRPDTWCDSPQSDICANCKQNKWGSAKSMSGKKAKACKESKRLIVVEPDDITGAHYILTVTIASLKNLTEYGKWLAANQLPYAAVVTELSFDEDADYPLLHFKFKSFLDEEDGIKAIELSQERSWASENSQKAIMNAPEEKKELPPAQENPKSPGKRKSTDELLDSWENE